MSPLGTILPTVALIGGFFVVVAALAFRAYRTRPRGGSEGIVGEVGVVMQRLDPEGLIFVHGETWRARSDEAIEPEEKVEVIEIRGLTLKVRRAGTLEM